MKHFSISRAVNHRWPKRELAHTRTRPNLPLLPSRWLEPTYFDASKPVIGFDPCLIRITRRPHVCVYVCASCNVSTQPRLNSYCGFWSNRMLSYFPLSVFLLFRPSVTGVTYQLFSIIWWFRPRQVSRLTSEVRRGTNAPKRWEWNCSGFCTLPMLVDGGVWYIFGILHV